MAAPVMSSIAVPARPGTTAGSTDSCVHLHHGRHFAFQLNPMREFRQTQDDPRIPQERLPALAGGVHGFNFQPAWSGHAHDGNAQPERPSILAQRTKAEPRSGLPIAFPDHGVTTHPWRWPALVRRAQLGAQFIHADSRFARCPAVAPPRRRGQTNSRLSAIKPSGPRSVSNCRTSAARHRGVRSPWKTIRRHIAAQRAQVASKRSADDQVRRRRS